MTNYVGSLGSLYPPFECDKTPASININLGDIFQNSSNEIIGVIKNTSNELKNNISDIRYNYQQVVYDTDKNALIKGDKWIEFKANNYMETRVDDNGFLEVLVKYDPDRDDAVMYKIIESKYPDGKWVKIRDIFVDSVLDDVKDSFNSLKQTFFDFIEGTDNKSTAVLQTIAGGGAITGIVGTVLGAKAVADGAQGGNTSNSEKLFYNYLLLSLSDIVNNHSNVIQITSNFAISTSNYAVQTSNIISTRITKDLINCSNFISNTSNYLDGYIYSSSNLISSRITGELINVSNYVKNTNANITSISTSKQDLLSVAPNSTIDITNNVISTDWKKTNGIVYNIDNNIGIGTSSVINGNKLQIQGKTELSNPNSINDYAVLNPLLLSLTKRVVFDIDSSGNKVCKELISKTTINYSQANINQQGSLYAGYIFINSGLLYIYDKNIPIYPLDTDSCSFSFWCYMPNPFDTSTIVNNYDYVSCQIFKIDQDKINALNYDRRRARILFVAVKNIFGNIVYVLYVKYVSNDSSPYNWYNAVSYDIPNANFFRTPHFYSFNLTKTSATIFIDGVQVATQTFGLPNPSLEWRLENFYFPTDKDPDVSNQSIVNQAFIYWNVYMNYNRLYSANEVASLYRYETDTLLNTLKVNGIVRTTALATDTIYLKGQEFSLPSSYNAKSLYEQVQEIDKLTTQTNGNRRSLSIDTVTVNSVNNIINNTGNSGYWYYSDTNPDTIAQVKAITYSEITGKPTLFDGNYNSLTNKPTLFDGNYASLTNKPTLFDGNYNSLTNKPTIVTPVQADWTMTTLTDLSYIKNKPTIVTPVQADWTMTTLTDLSYIKNKPTLFDGNYNSLTNKPTIVTPVQADWTMTTLSDLSYIKNKPILFDGNYNSLTNKPTIVTPVQADWTMTTLSDLSYIKNKPTLFDGNYNSLTNKPTLFDGNYNSLTNKLTAGTNITIDANNIISSSGGGTSSQWTTNTGYISYNNVQVYPSEVRIYIPPITFNAWVRYKFLSASLTADSSGNSRTLTTTGTYSLQDSKDTLSLATNQDATISSADWSTFTDLTIAGWFKNSALADGDKLLEFKTTVIEQPYSTLPAGATINAVSGSSTDYYLQFTTGSSSDTSYSVTFTRNITCDVLVIGGGGSGGSRFGGGGGAGACVYLTNQTLSAGTYTITVGKGGAGLSAITAQNSYSGNDGSDSSIKNIANTNIYLAKGGGGGSGNHVIGRSGGSAGGSSGTYTTTQTGTVLTTNVPTGSYGNIGGKGTTGVSNSIYLGGGGGGAGGVGSDATSSALNTGAAGNGGAGLQLSITGTSAWYAAGGGGGGGNAGGVTGTAGSGGSGVGGNGAVGYNTTGQAGQNNTGSGGGGTGYTPNQYGTGATGAGGTGIVIIRYNASVEKNILIKKVNTVLSFQINNAQVFSTPSTNSTWSHILWNVKNSANTPFVRISTASEGTENTYAYTALSSGTYTNKLGSISNTGTIYINDFRIVTIPLTTAIKYDLFNQFGSYKTLVDDANLTTQLATKQNALTAGTGITISNNIISIPWTTNGNNITFYSAINQGNVGIGVNSPNTYRLEVNGTFNASTIYESGTLISGKYADIGHNHNTSYLSLSGGSLSGNLAVLGNINGNNFILPSTTDSAFVWDGGKIAALGRASANQSYSYDALIGDVVLRSDNRVLIQSGEGAAGIKITGSSLQTGVIEAYGKINAYQTSGPSISVSGVLRIGATDTNYWEIVVGSVDGGTYPNVGNLNFSAAGFTVGYVEDDLGASYKMNFTGQHRTISSDKSLYDDKYIGYIVSTTSKYKAINGKYKSNYTKENININDALPIVELSNKAYDKSVFGVISDRVEDENHYYSSGNFISVFPQDGGDSRLIVNGGGEGSIWVTNYNGNLENGDYITTSPIAGLGMKQDSEQLCNYTVAKITMDCDFNPQLIPVEVIKQQEYYVGSNILTSNVLDIQGNPVYEYKLDESSNIVYDYEYEVKTVMYNDVEYKMAFVGATYKCS